MRVRRYLLAAGCGSLFACNMILGVGDLEGPKKQKDSGFDWGDDPFDSGTTYSPPDTGLPDATTPITTTAKRVFVTSAKFPPSFGGIPGGNAACTAAAAKAGLGGTWVAWLSGGTTLAIDQLADGPYATMTGATVVANKGTLLDGGLGAAIDEMEDGKKAPRDAVNGVWTGTRYGGAVGETCKVWADTGVVTLGTAGSFDKTDKNWTDNGGQPLISSFGWSCSNQARLYCFEQ